MLILSRTVGQSLMIQDHIEIIVTEVIGDKVKLGIKAPKDVKVLRKELYQTAEINQEAAQWTPSQDALVELFQALTLEDQEGSSSSR